MKSRPTLARCLGFLVLSALAAARAGAQVETVQRIAGMVAIAADEYGKGIDARVVTETLVLVGDQEAEEFRIDLLRLRREAPGATRR